MRRALLTTGKAAGLTVGNSTDTSSGGNSTAYGWDDCNPASAAGVLNTVTVVSSVGTTTDYAIFTISPANVVTAISATITASIAAGVNTITLPAPLTVNAGDYIGIWFSGGTGVVSYADPTPGFTRRYGGTAIVKPSAGSTITPTGTLANSHWLISATT